MRSVKNALGVADNTAYTYGATLPMNQGLGMNQGYGFNQGLGMNQGYGFNQGLNQGLGMNQGLGYGAQQFGNQGWGSSGLSSGLPAQAVVQTTTVPIETPPSPAISQAPLTPSSQNWQQSSSQNWQQSSNQQQSLPIQKQYQQGQVQRREAAPVVHERIRREEVEEIQPVIHREREKTEIHRITQPIQTSSTLGIINEEGTLPAQVNPEIRTPGMMCPSAPLPTREQLAGQRMRVEKPALIIETEKKNIIEEVQPVVYKEVVEPHIIHLTQPIYERIVEGEVYYNETLPTRTEFTQFQQQPQFQQRDLSQQQQFQQGQHFLQPIQIKTFVQPVPVAMSSPFVGQPLMKENLEVAATYVSEVPSHKGRYGSYGKGSSYAYGPGTATSAPLAQPRAI